MYQNIQIIHVWSSYFSNNYVSYKSYISSIYSIYYNEIECVNSNILKYNNIPVNKVTDVSRFAASLIENTPLVYLNIIFAIFIY